jgi:hypothetical protein
MAYEAKEIEYGWDVYCDGKFYEFSAGNNQGLAEMYFVGERRHALACWYKDECGKHTYMPSQY